MPATGAALHSHSVTKDGKTMPGEGIISAQVDGPISMALSYSSIPEGGTYKHCILFPEQPKRGGSQGAISWCWVFFSVVTVYQSPYNKTLGKDGILVCHEKSIMHCHATNQADLFLFVSEILSCELM